MGELSILLQVNTKWAGTKKKTMAASDKAYSLYMLAEAGWALFLHMRSLQILFLLQCLALPEDIQEAGVSMNLFAGY